MARVFANVHINLVGEFASRSKNQRPYRMTRGRGARVGMLQQKLKDRKRKSRCLTGTRLCSPHHVMTLHHHRDGLRLNRRGLAVAQFMNRSQDGLGQPKGLEGDGWRQVCGWGSRRGLAR